MSRASGSSAAAAGSSSSSAAAMAVPFIQSDAAGHFSLQPAASKMLQAIKGKICPVIVCGPYRTGEQRNKSSELRAVSHVHSLTHAPLISFEFLGKSTLLNLLCLEEDTAIRRNVKSGAGASGFAVG